MWEKIQKDKWIIIGIIFLSLIPLLWFKSSYIITGTDLDFPLFPQDRLRERSFAWYPKVLGGTDRSVNFASLPYVLSLVVIKNLGVDLITVEKVSYVFWFLLSGLAMYFLMSVLLNLSSGWTKMAKFSAVMIYMINFYQVFLWARLQLALAALILFPIFLGLIIGVCEKKISTSKSVLILSITSVLCAAIGIQPPLIFALFLALILYLIFYSIHEVRKYRLNEVGRVWLSFILLTIIFFASSAFWAIPLLNFIKSSGYGDSTFGQGVYSVQNLLSYVSSVTSFLNIFRLYGEVFWFDSWGGERYSPEFLVYQTNPFIILSSFILPLLVVLSLFLIKKNKNILYFGMLTLLSLFLSKGTHAPFGNVYAWMVTYIPLFWIQRAPWQKFAILTVIGYSVLSGAILGKIFGSIVNKIKKTRYVYLIYYRSYINISFISILIILILGYNFIFVSGRMFPSREGSVGYHKKYKLGYHQKFPDYIFQARSWINSKMPYFKIYLLPDDKTNVYDWGFGASGDVSTLLFSKGIINRQYGEGFAPPHPVENLNNIFVGSIYNDLSGWNVRILKLLGVKYILQRNDFRYNFYGDTDSPEFIRSKLLSQNNLSLEKTFGKWDFYKINNPYPFIYVPDHILISDGGINYLLPILNSNILSDNKIPAIFFDNNKLAINNKLPERLSSLAIRIPVTDNIINIGVKDGGKIKFSWYKEEYLINTDPIFEARYYEGSKGVISDDGSGEEDMLVFERRKKVPYKMLNNITSWSASNSTLVYIKTGITPFLISGIYENNKTITDIIGIWWETDWRGAGTKAVQFPLLIPSNQKVIIQIGHLIKGNIILERLPSLNIQTELDKISSNFETLVEYKRIIPSKYRIKIHKVRDAFPLVVAENFQKAWKAYIVKSVDKLAGSQVSELKDYKILDGNEEDQATEEEIRKFVEMGWVTALGDGRNKEIKHMKYENGKDPSAGSGQEKLDYVEKYRIDFVSKNFQDTIQNDNLPNGPFYETWFKKPLDEKNHLMVNGYANSWIINPDEICSSNLKPQTSNFCIKNADGSYDMELVVEFWPQRLFYIGLFISGMTLLGCIGYLIYDWKRKKSSGTIPQYKYI